MFRLEHTRKQVTFRCGTLSEFRSWTKAIEALQQETEARRKTVKAGELARMTEFYHQNSGGGAGGAGMGMGPNDGSMSSFRYIK